MLTSLTYANADGTRTAIVERCDSGDALFLWSVTCRDYGQSDHCLTGYLHFCQRIARRWVQQGHPPAGAAPGGRAVQQAQGGRTIMSERPAVPLPRDPDAIVMPTADEHAAILAMFHAVEALKARGWREAIYAPDDESRLLLIEVGSTGIHRGYRDKQRNFWTYDGDIWPSRPAMFKKDGTR